MPRGAHLTFSANDGGSCNEPDAFSSRQKRLEGKTLGTGTNEGKTYDRWQYEVTARGRIIYFDDPTDGGRKKPQRPGRVDESSKR